MAISNDFQFSQASLQDFQDCKRRFFYRYVERLSWPALETEPALANEEWMRQGARFHQLVHQYFLGLPIKRLSELSLEENLETWWQGFLDHNPVEPGDQFFPEKLLVTKHSGFTLVAKFDLVVLGKDSSLSIYDWKTSRKPGSRNQLSNRLQTKVYSYVLARAGHAFTNQVLVDPEKIRMIYWYANRPSGPEEFLYSSAQLLEDEQSLLGLMEECVSLDKISDHPKTENINHCRYCVYRSLCDRGEQAGPFDEYGDEIDSMFEDNFDLDQIPEIEF